MHKWLKERVVIIDSDSAVDYPDVPSIDLEFWNAEIHNVLAMSEGGVHDGLGCDDCVEA